MKYRYLKSKLIILLFQTMKMRLLDFHCLGLLFLLYFMNSRLKVLPKKFKYSILVLGWRLKPEILARGGGS